MNINKMKSFVIIILVITAVYQTGLLWLEDTASHNFFYTVFGLGGQKQITAEENTFLLPSKFVIGSGNRKYAVAYASDIEKEAILSEGDNLLQEILMQGTADTATQKINWEAILEEKCLLLEYHFSIPVVEYFQNYSKKLLIPSLKSFNCICFNLFRDSVFVPQWKEKSLPYRSIMEINPFMQDGSINRYYLENSVDSFFKNLESDWNRVDEAGTFVFSDETVVVRYYPKGILEYYSYERYNTEAATDIATGYKMCKNFMNNDVSLETDVYLSGIEINRNETIYYFDYTVDNYPILFSEAIQKEFEMPHAIEFSIRGNSVRKYKRYAHNFKAVDSKDKEISVEFLEALDQAIEQYQINHENAEVKEVEDMYLAYFVEPNFSVTMKWITELYNELYIGKTVSDKKT